MIINSLGYTSANLVIILNATLRCKCHNTWVLRAKRVHPYKIYKYNLTHRCAVSAAHTPFQATKKYNNVLHFDTHW